MTQRRNLTIFTSATFSVLRRIALTIALFAAALLACASPAAGQLLPPLILDGPSADVRELGGVAMADDGTGGVAYLLRDPSDGRVHVYASRFDGQHWYAPQRVDVDQPGLPQPFDSSWVRIGAAREGRLVVTWAQPIARDPMTDLRFDAMYSAVLPRGSSRFLPPTVIDFDIRDSRDGAYPSLAVNSSGQGLLCYRVVTAVGGRDLGTVPAGFVQSQTRVARFDGSRWSVLGNRANRNSEAFVTAPTAGNSPKCALDPQGNGVVAFQEPDDRLRIDRVWVRRIFGGIRFGVPLQASPGEFAGRPLNGPADLFSLVAAPYGQVAVAWRQQPGPRSPLAGPRAFVNMLPILESPGAGKFTGAVPADGTGAGAPPELGAISVASAEAEQLGVAFAAAGNIFLFTRDDEGRTRTASLPGAGRAPANPLVALAPDGDRTVVAWQSTDGGGQAEVQQRQEGELLAAGTLGVGGGAVNGLAMADSDHGDAIVAIEQGEVTSGRIAVRVVDAPPDPFALFPLNRWVRSAPPSLRWEPAFDALGPIRYRVVIDKRTVADTTRQHAKVRLGRVRDGIHRVQVTAIDGSGQGTTSKAATLRIDRRPPRARLQRHGHTVVFTSTDGRKRRVSGPARSGNLVRWGDGTKARGSLRKPLRHTYERPGNYRIVATLRDRAGNVAVRRLRVTIGS